MTLEGHMSANLEDNKRGFVRLSYCCFTDL